MSLGHLSVTKPFLNMNDRFRVLSLFSGCGGLDVPFTEENYVVVKAYDNDPAAIRCLRGNLGIDASVLDVTTPTFNDELKKIGNVDLVLGGFPCQGFSKAGPKNSTDPRNKLYQAMLKAVEETQPSLFLAENVDGMAQNFNGSFVKTITGDFQRAGYEVTSRILNAVNFGVPQYRRRIFFVGVKKHLPGLFTWPEETHFGMSRNGEFRTEWEVDNQPNLFRKTELIRPLTLGDAIGDLLDADAKVPDHECDTGFSSDDIKIMSHIGEGQKLCNVRFSDTAIYTWNIPEAFGETTEREKKVLLTIGKNRRKRLYGSIPNGNPLSPSVISELSGFEVGFEELTELARRGFLKRMNDRFDLKGAMFCSGLYKRPKWNEPSPTVLTVFNNPRFFFHPRYERPFTVRECARLQSFPDTFRFLDTGISIKDAYRLIGNAVPPGMACAFEKQIRRFLQKTRSAYAPKIATA